MLTKEQQQLVIDNEKLIFSYMNRFGLLEDDIEDWYGLLAFALCKAARSFNETKGFKFSTYAWTCLNHEVWNIKNRERSVTQVLSLDETVPDTDGLTYVDIIPSDEDMESDIIDMVCKFDNKKLLQLYDKLKPLHREIIYLYFVEELKQTEIADKIGVTRQRISKICCDFVNKVKKNFETV